MKQSAALAKIELKYKLRYEALFHAKMNMLMQMGQDVAMIAAHEVLQMGPGRAKDFCQRYIESMNELARMVCEDQVDDAEFVYTKSKVDEYLLSIVGEENFRPWEERYGER